MLLSVIHANGTYDAHLESHDPLSTFDEDWDQSQYHNRLAGAITKHISSSQPVLYIPYWNNSHLTDVFTNPNARERALMTDPLMKKLGHITSNLNFFVFPMAAGRSTIHAGHHAETEKAWFAKLKELVLQEGEACFVGAYTRACVADIANIALKNTGLPITIDPTLSVDVYGEGYSATEIAVPFKSLVKLI
jgi:hypothetical protein